MIIRKIRDGDRWLYVIGSFVPKIGLDDVPWYDWEPLVDFTTLDEAAEYLNILNGGNK